MTTGPKCCRMLPNANRNRWALPRRGEAFHYPFPDPGRLMGVLGPVVEVLPPAVDHRRQNLAGSDLIAGQLVAGAGSPPTQPVAVVRPELGTPGPDRLVADHHTAGNHQLLNVAQAQRKTVIQPHACPMTSIGCRPPGTSYHDDAAARQRGSTAENDQLVARSDVGRSLSVSAANSVGGLDLCNPRADRPVRQTR